MKTKLTAIMTPQGIQYIKPGKVEEYFKDIADDLLPGFTYLNALGIVSIEFMEQLPLLTYTGSRKPTEIIDALKNGIIAAKGNPEQEIQRARQNFNDMPLKDRTQLIVAWWMS